MKADGLYMRCAHCGAMVPEEVWQQHVCAPVVQGGQGRTVEPSDIITGIVFGLMAVIALLVVAALHS